MSEKEVLADLLSEISSDDTFYDVGANVGMYTCFVGQYIDSNHVFAFEPHPKNANRLNQNLTLNDISAKIKRHALSNKTGTAQLQVKESGETGVGSHSLSTDETVRNINIETVRGDEIARKEQSPTVLKIDVEGAEMDVLYGLEESISDCRVIYCEIHPDALPDFGSQPEDILDYLEDNGFKTETTFEFGESSSGYMVKARKNGNE